ncbi:hypothetical protein Tco_0762001 [Tanacetum coccineum]
MSNTNNNLQTQTSSALHNDTVSSCSISKVQEKTQLLKEGCMKSLKALQSHFTFLTDTLKDFGGVLIFKITFSQDMNLLEKHLTKQIICKADCKTALTQLRTMFEDTFNSELREFFSKEDLKGTCIEHGFKRAFMSLFGQDDDTFTSTIQYQKFIDSQFSLDYDSQMTNEYFAKYTGIEVKQFRDTLLQYMSNVKKSVAERTRHQRHGIESEVQDDSSRTLIKAGLTSTEQCQVKSPMLDSSLDNMTTEFSSQSLKSKNSFLKNTIAQFQKDFSRMKAHCIALKLKYQNQALKFGQHGQILNETSNKAKIKKEIVAYETIDIELEHSVAKLLTENKHLNMENETMKKHYKDSYSAFAKPNQVIASSESRNSSKNMPRFSSNDMVYNYYLEEDKEKTQERNRNSKSSVMHTVSSQNTTKGSKPKRRSTNQTSRSLPVSKSSCVTITLVPKADHSKDPSSSSDSKHFVCSICHKCVFNANHDACIIKFLKEVNSHAKIQSNKTRNNNKSIDQKSYIQKPNRQIFTRHRFSFNKSSTVNEKTSPRSCLRWKPTGIIFKTIGLRWVPTGKKLASCTSKADSEPIHGSNVDISKIHECKQTLDLSAGTSINVQKEQRIDLSAGTSYKVNKENLRAWLLKKLISQKPVLKWIQD